MRTKLERIDRILSTKRSADILKYQQGAKFIAIGLGQTLYSPNGANWYTDLGLTTPTSIVDLNAYQISLLNPVTTNGLNIINNPNSITNNSNYTVTSNTLSAIGGIGTALGAYQKTEDSRLTRGLDTGYDFIAENAANYGPYGLIVSGAMKTAGAITDATLALGLKTDLQTKFDKVFGSKFLALTPTGIINSGFGKESNDFSMDREVMEKVGGGYVGTVNDMYDLEELAGKRYGLFSSKARQRVNEAIAGMQNKQGQLENIGTEAELQRLNVKSGVEQSRLSYENMINGGYGQKYTYSAKEGGILELEPIIELEWTPDFQEGGELEWNPLFDNKTRTIDELIEYAKKENPRFIQRMSEPLRYIRINTKEADGSLSWRHATHEMTYRGNEVFPMIQEIDGKLYMFNTEDDAYNNAKKNNNIITFDSEDEAKLFAISGEDKDGKLFGYKSGWSEFFKTSPVGIKEEYSINRFKDGGKTDEKLPLDPSFEVKDTTQKNVIPEGALHKNKHHMEHAEGLTKKGIPVVDNDGNLQAEIEHSEIVFNLQTTKDLEELYKIFYSYEASLKEKDKAAIDAGKILVEQILFNTDDRTQLIESCKNGGLLTI